MAAHGAAPGNQSPLPILLGVMSNPMNARMRTQWREWAQLFSERARGVDESASHGGRAGE